MDNFQRLLESPFRWLAGLPARLPMWLLMCLARRHAGEFCAAVDRRRQQALRRKYMNG